MTNVPNESTMSDNKLRCALVFRLSSSSGGKASESTLLAKYDHAADGKEKNYADAVGMVVGGDPPRGISEEGAIGGFKIVQSDMHQIIYGADTQGLCLAVVTGLKYPSRTAVQMLTELYAPYSEQFSLQFEAATTNALSKNSKPLLSEYCKKYDDSTKVDKASSLNAKVELVKGTMQDNIATMLKNTEQAESLAERSNQLNEQATVFQKKSKDLRKQMKWKNIKMTIILVSLVVGILVIILVPLIMRAKRAVTGKRMLRGGELFLEELGDE